MIYTVTFNPALDYIVETPELILGMVNRTTQEDILFGGKGLNVSMILKTLGVPSIALAFIAGFTGEAIEKAVKEQGIITDFMKLEEGMSRINVKIKAREESEINGSGPDIKGKELNTFLQKLNNLKEEDILILAGSIPKALPQNIYQRIMEQLSTKNINFVVDATKDLLLHVLKYKPFLIKPNSHELGDLFGIDIKTEEEIIFYAKKLREKGAQNVLISMAKDGAILVTQEGKTLKMKAATGQVINSVGAGDAMVAGFLAGYLKTRNYEYALKLGSAAGSATAFSKGMASKTAIYSIMDKLT